MGEERSARSTWTFLTSHARVLSAIARNPEARFRDLAAALQLTERTVQAVVADLEAAGYLTHSHEGRRNKYQVLEGGRFRHPAEDNRRIAPLLEILAAPDETDSPAAGDGPEGEESSTDHRNGA
ncbi:helix-turn-helix transcriptional regulator [Streptomyces sp. NPDC059828]|uniref:helix-turn-helix transcriptional regulator n=1 Tax=Streptomyces sp. NPDC059828 TaxID=3346965 RepID=UPI00365FA14F